MHVAQVLRVSLLNAASVAKVFLTSDVIITEIPEPEPAGAGAGGGMDAMGGY
jgi:chaperonin GroEL